MIYGIVDPWPVCCWLFIDNYSILTVVDTFIHSVTVRWFHWPITIVPFIDLLTLFPFVENFMMQWYIGDCWFVVGNSPTRPLTQSDTMTDDLLLFEGISFLLLLLFIPTFDDHSVVFDGNFVIFYDHSDTSFHLLTVDLFISIPVMLFGDTDSYWYSIHCWPVLIYSDLFLSHTDWPIVDWNSIRYPIPDYSLFWYDPILHCLMIFIPLLTREYCAPTYSVFIVDPFLTHIDLLLTDIQISLIDQWKLTVHSRYDCPVTFP